MRERLYPPPSRGRRLRVGADALFVDGVVGVAQQDVGEAGLQQVHGEEGRLLHDLQGINKRSNESQLCPVDGAVLSIKFFF